MILRRSGPAITALSALALLAGCTTTRQDSPDTFDGEIVVGVDLELTGPAAEIGTVNLRALQITADRINETGVKVGAKHMRIRLAVRDNGSDPTRAAQEARNLADDDHAAAIIGAGTTPVSLGIIGATEALRVPTVSLGASDALVTPLAERRYTFKVAPNAGDVAEAVVDNARRLGARRVGVLTASSAYGDLVTRALTPAITARAAEGMRIVRTERFAEDGTDVADRWAAVLAANPDTVVIGALMPGAGRAIAAVRASGFTGKVFLDPTAGADNLLAGQNRADAEGMYMVHPAVLDPYAIANSQTAIAQHQFRKKYVEKYDYFSGLAPNAYDALYLVTEAIASAGGTERDRIRDMLEHTTYYGIAGNYSFTSSNHGGMRPDTLALFVVRNGGWARAI
ncbi:branched-chain amino acid ABC transporter substrate-binding protein [Longispora fulva]|uniref:Branched-chain amino acid transport system substrate-binding protein n=1 Tax=Longispora fulva TaxID=619741 RepID=A0A8J7KHU5_9ACTN|nr:ABC transporter substrate-binding protein [Longispora fulva]MBG6135649.1 branched-chain amino acid transport system substrate-binding protein [Longispora fulva]GIG56112.1 branched-chain amino acid ABC transporter substrate-binding protein [Longispora fulva]